MMAGVREYQNITRISRVFDDTEIRLIHVEKNIVGTAIFAF
jgi:hypothetical protein